MRSRIAAHLLPSPGIEAAADLIAELATGEAAIPLRIAERKAG
jgi:hypothetical protein